MTTIHLWCDSPRTPKERASGSLDTGLAMRIKNPVNLRGSLNALPEEGSCEWTPERSASCVDQLRAAGSGAVGAQPERTGLVGGKSACPTRGERGILIYGSRAVGWTGRGRFDRA